MFGVADAFFSSPFVVSDLFGRTEARQAHCDFVRDAVVALPAAKARYLETNGRGGGLLFWKRVGSSVSAPQWKLGSNAHFSKVFHDHIGWIIVLLILQI